MFNLSFNGEEECVFLHGTSVHIVRNETYLDNIKCPLFQINNVLYRKCLINTYI